MGELPYTEQYFKIGGFIGLYAHIVEFVRIKIGFEIGYVTEHFLTFENVGEDIDEDGQVLPNSPTTPSPDLLNPYFCGNAAATGREPDLCDLTGQPSYDQVGFRLKAERQIYYNLVTSLTLTF